MNLEREIFSSVDPEAEAASDARAEADIAAGRGVPHAEVAKWLKKWGTPDEEPAPPEWFK
jgi:predicted transcriptional regulator